jgi:hypothetical protein
MPDDTPTPRPPVSRGAVAGSLLVASTLLGAAIGLGIGALVGLAAVLAIVGLLAGSVVGVWVVRARFRDL